MDFLKIVNKKNIGLKLSNEEISFVIQNYTDNIINDDEMTLFLRAIYKQGMNDEETYYLTKVMQNSGKTYTFDYDVVDKHSSGGVSDSTTLIIVPALACLGLKVAKMSGGALGFTGGTADKLRVFDGYDLYLSEQEFKNEILTIGGSMITQSEDIALADKKIYALRDRTNLIDSIPLIASSIMSKKLACGAQTILLDVKYGSGGFMKSKNQAIKLAKLMVKIGLHDGKNIRAVVTNMNLPLSYGVGCSLEVYSVINALRGEDSDLRKLSIILSSHLLSMNKKTTFKKAMLSVEKLFKTNDIEEKLKQIIQYQGGSVEVFDNTQKLLSAPQIIDVKCDKSGYISDIDAYLVAVAENILQDSSTNANKRKVGVLLKIKVGDYVQKGDIIAKLYCDEGNIGNAELNITKAIEINNKRIRPHKLVAKIIKG